MARLDWKRGRFSPDFETNEIEGGLRGWQDGYGDSVDYYRFDSETTVVNDIYDEGDQGGKRYHGPWPLPVLHVTHEEGGTDSGDIGQYYNDDLYVVAGFNEVAKVGLTKADLQTGKYLNDRMVYDGKVFVVRKISVTGQIQRRDIMVSFECTQVGPDELVNDAQFQAFSD